MSSERATPGSTPRSTVAAVELDAVTGIASVLTEGDPPSSAPQAATARAWLEVAERAADPDTRVVAARRGLEELGDEHDRGGGTESGPEDGTDDDTGQRLAAARSVADTGVRAALLSGALEARLTLYQWRHEDRGLRFDPPLDELEPDDLEPDDLEPDDLDPEDES